MSQAIAIRRTLQGRVFISGTDRPTYKIFLSDNV